MDDHELLKDYALNRSEDAFRELLTRHLSMVYSTAHRMVRDAQLAEEVAQNVFTTLAQKANSFSESTIVGGWIYNTTRNISLLAIRTEKRRRENEFKALTMSQLDEKPEPDAILENLEPIMAELSEKDRAVLVLRFFENRSLKGVGHELHVNEDAARMRVNRALEEMRRRFERKGIRATTVLLATILAGSSVGVPSGLASTILTSVLAGLLTGTQITTLLWMNTKIAAGIIGAAFLAGTGVYWIAQREVNDLQSANRLSELQRQKAVDELNASLKTTEAQELELQSLRKHGVELLQLRNEVGQLRKEQSTSLVSVAKPAIVRPVSSGAYIARDQLMFSGYDTPEAGFLTHRFAAMTGNLQLMTNSLDVRGQAPPGTDMIEAMQRVKNGMATLNGVQILARKVISENQVELKAWEDQQSTGPAKIEIATFYRTSNQWKIGGIMPYSPVWEEDGKVQTFSK